jgi:hypothetical protein
MGILLMIGLGVLLLGPKWLHTVVGHVARAKAQFERASRAVKSQLEAELEARRSDMKPIPPRNWMETGDSSAIVLETGALRPGARPGMKEVHLA